ncbi:MULTISPECIES: sigma factor-like helix-turn-helix DNA-binding protein [Rhodococcus]|uniref:sigma factor-like helix-turn-helix DNA-binding protein n=1 Tax=Rhodococcus TaxID=1827 RepID=UPI000C7CD38D|nr:MULTISPECIES: sigma factor-like helix-turn-helix DNA-binding protein [Rhodococcus]AUM16473.1 hypothetical protein CSW53_08015 [Rhodococcus ruber]
MTDLDNTTTTSTFELRDRALEMLDVLRQRQESNRLHRVHYMQLARQYGCTHQQIGDALGVSEAAVRAMLKRAGGDA